MSGIFSIATDIGAFSQIFIAKAEQHPLLSKEDLLVGPYTQSSTPGVSVDGPASDGEQL